MKSILIARIIELKKRKNKLLQRKEGCNYFATLVAVGVIDEQIEWIEGLMADKPNTSHPVREKG